VEPKWNLCNAPGGDNGGKVKSVGAFLESGEKILVCTHATFRFAVDEYGVEKFDDRLIAVDEFHHVSANPDNKLGVHLGQFMTRNRVLASMLPKPQRPMPADPPLFSMSSPGLFLSSRAEEILHRGTLFVLRRTTREVKSTCVESRCGAVV
jgi:hypothetical protein